MPRATLRSLLLVTALTAAGVGAAPSSAWAGKGGGSSKAGADRTAPSVRVASPTAGASVPSSFTVSGSAGDNVGVTRVLVSVDGGNTTTASGTTSWSWTTPSLAAGSHTVRATAYDGAGNSTSASVSVSVATTSTSRTTTTTGNDLVLHDPAALNELQLLGRGRDAEWGSVSALLYAESFTSRHAAFFRDSATGTSAYVDLPSTNPAGWSLAAYTLTSASDLWVLGGGGPMVLRHYRLSGGAVPTSAALASEQTFGDSDSRAGDLVRLASGAVVGIWHQQGSTGPQGQWVVHVPASGGSAQVSGPYTAGISRSSKQVLAQHPADGSVWLFSEADATGTVAALTFTEANGSLSLRSTDESFLNVTKYGDDGPDSENPDLAVAPDASTGTLVLAYQDAHRIMFQTSPTVVTGSWVTLARIPASGTPSFSHLPVYVERISSLSLAVQPGAVWLGYRPVDTATMTFDHLWWNVQRNGSWGTPVELGQMASSWERLSFGAGHPQVATLMADRQVHVFTLA
jgi:hypothetical protein